MKREDQLATCTHSLKRNKLNNHLLPLTKNQNSMQEEKNTKHISTCPFSEESSLGMSAATDNHYHAINRIVDNLREALTDGGFLQCKVNREVVILQKQERVPDITIWVSGNGENLYDRTVSLPIVTVEVVHTTDNVNYSTESIMDTLTRCPTLQEAFIYDYESGKWTRFWRNGSIIEHQEDDDFSLTYGIWMSEMSKMRHMEDYLDAITKREIQIRFDLARNFERNLRTSHSRLQCLLNEKTTDSVEQAPEISLWRKNRDGEMHSPYMTVNFTSSPQPNTHRNYFKIIFHETPTLREAFLYNRILDTWVRCTRVGDNHFVEEENDYSRTLGRHMRTLLR